MKNSIQLIIALFMMCGFAVLSSACGSDESSSSSSSALESPNASCSGESCIE